MKQTFNLIQEITKNDGTAYFELGNILMNGRAELASEKGLIKQVRIIKLNIPRSSRVEIVENYLNNNYEVPTTEMTEWIEWTKTPDVQEVFNQILMDNQVG